MSGEPTYIELGTPHAGKATAFYAALFGWELTAMPGGGSATTSTLGIGFHGGDPSTHHEVFYAVDGLEAAMTSITNLGGTLIGDIHDSPGFGRWTECKDNQGAPFGIVVRVPSAPRPQVWPSLIASDARALIAFLVTAFGFLEVVTYGEGTHVDHAELAWPEGGGVMLGSGGTTETCNRATGSFGGYVVTANPDAVCDRAVANGATISLAPHDTDYGSRSFTALDPEGNVWSFGTYPGSPVPR